MRKASGEVDEVKRRKNRNMSKIQMGVECVYAVVKKVRRK